MNKLAQLPTKPSPATLADHADLEFIKVCTKDVKRDDGSTFPAFFGYRKLYNPESCEFVDVMTPSFNEKKEPIMVAKSFRLILDDVIKAQFLKDKLFPVILAVSKTEGDYFVTIDKDRDTKKPKLDKNGKKHAIIGIRGYRELINGLSSMSLDDLDDIE